jgi:hypothetical protein
MLLLQLTKAHTARPAENADYGITIGHRDTDNLITNCEITDNGKVGILVGRPECKDAWLGARALWVRGEMLGLIITRTD